MTLSTGKLKLSANGMTNIASSKKENDFTFVVGTEFYTCPWFVAVFLSPRIAHLHAIDPSVDEYVVETEDSAHQFNDFLRLGGGVSIDVTEQNHRFLLLISSELGNYEV
jgi:hypothetical protein